MSFPEIIPFVLAAVGGIGGLANALAGMEMVDALNTKRPADNQIPNPPVTRTEFAWFLKNPGFGYWVAGGNIATNFRTEICSRGRTRACSGCFVFSLPLLGPL
jgi:hypothetical protein